MLLSTDLWVSALIRRAELAGAFATVARKGDARAGTVIVKAFDTSNRRARLYSEAFGPDGERLRGPRRRGDRRRRGCVWTRRAREGND